MPLFAIDVRIVRWVSDDQPGIVECSLTDRFGQDWRFIEKLPVVSTLPLDGDSSYPSPGVIACQVVSIGRDRSGREFAEVDTGLPWGIEAVDGTTRFQVFVDELIELTGR
jgi:hypothetical protein